MRVLISALLTLISLFMMFSCENKGVKTEVKNWCNCMKAADENPILRDSCTTIMENLSDNYKDNKKVINQIQEQSAECY